MYANELPLIDCEDWSDYLEAIVLDSVAADVTEDDLED